jgi:hypothetical protein
MILSMKTPDITPAQIAALVQASLAVALAFGLDITEEQSVALLALSGAVFAVLGIGDATVRKARNKRLSKGGE